MGIQGTINGSFAEASRLNGVNPRGHPFDFDTDGGGTGDFDVFAFAVNRSSAKGMLANGRG